MFDEREAARKLRLYRKFGPNDTTKILVEAMKRKGVEDNSLLDVGGGIGAIQNELLKVGIARSDTAEA